MLETYYDLGIRLITWLKRKNFLYLENSAGSKIHFKNSASVHVGLRTE
jgi:hypothetical protein